jgi:hypothetical protein
VEKEDFDIEITGIGEEDDFEYSAWYGWSDLKLDVLRSERRKS